MTDVYIIVNNDNSLLYASTNYQEAKDEFNTIKLPGYNLYKVPAGSWMLLKKA